MKTYLIYTTEETQKRLNKVCKETGLPEIYTELDNWDIYPKPLPPLEALSRIHWTDDEVLRLGYDPDLKSLQAFDPEVERLGFKPPLRFQHEKVTAKAEDITSFGKFKEGDDLSEK